MLRTTLTLSTVYLLMIALGLFAFPLQFGIGAVPTDASPQLLALLRLLGGPFLGIALLNWMSRNADARTLEPVLIANLVGFGAVAVNDLWGVALGEARDIAKYFLIVHLAFAIAFLILVRSTRTAGGH